MLFLGMCVYLSSSYEIQSNIERGHGRADIVLKAKRPGRANYIFEFVRLSVRKFCKDKTD